MCSFLNNDYDMNDPVVVSALDEAPLWSVPFGQKILDIVKMQRNLKVLDVGCGLGFPLIELSQRLGNSCQCFGIDPWKAAIQRARDKANIWRLDSVDFCEGVAEDMPFENELFDVVFSNNGLNNVDDDAKSMQEIARVMKPNGQLVLTFNLDETFAEFYMVFENVLLQNGEHESITRLKAHIYAKRKPVNYWLTLLDNNGFAVTNVFTDHFSFRYVDGTALLNHFFIKLAFLPSWLEIVEEDAAQMIFSQLEDELNHKAQHAGGLRLTVPWVTIDSVKRVT